MRDNDLCPLCENDDSKIESLNVDWIQCEVCKKWYHLHCLGVSLNDANLIREYHCPFECDSLTGPSILKRVSKRATKKKIDYVALNEGISLREVDQHPHISKFKEFQNDTPIDELIYLVSPEVDGVDKGDGIKIIDDVVISNIILKTKLRKPIMIKNANSYTKAPSVPKPYDYYELDFNFPKDLTVSKITDVLGEDRPLEVMDVLSQNNSGSWTLGMWRDYYNKQEADRDRIRNVISLEVSETPLSEEIRVPAFVTAFNVVENMWTESSPQFLDLLDKFNIRMPKITKYVLMSVKNSFTDFHVDFGGTSVYYTVLRGHKTFIMYPPTEQNLKAYENWCQREDQNSTWFGDLVTPISEQSKTLDASTEDSYLNNGIKIEISPGDLLVLPSGWIHAVFTPCDSLVIGGNFLTSLNLPTHLSIYGIECATKVPEKFKFPNFIKIVWLIGFYYMTHRDNNYGDISITDYELSSMNSLLDFYKLQLSQLNSPDDDLKIKKLKRTIKSSLPPVSIIGKPEEFVKEFQAWFSKMIIKREPKGEENCIHEDIKKSFKRQKVSKV